MPKLPNPQLLPVQHKQMKILLKSSAHLYNYFHLYHLYLSQMHLLQFSTSSSTSQANLLPSASSIKSTTKIESRLPKAISSAAAPENSLNTSASSLSAEMCPVPTISNKFATLQPSVHLSESATTTPNSKLF
ncbi:hypothetical protein TNCV_1207871 [Trichonephila clavipes]|nr:hypothetical protein TNCV_1207871 [Trichonephila clavipes]